MHWPCGYKEEKSYALELTIRKSEVLSMSKSCGRARLTLRKTNALLDAQDLRSCLGESLTVGRLKAKGLGLKAYQCAGSEGLPAWRLESEDQTPKAKG